MTKTDIAGTYETLDDIVKKLRETEKKCTLLFAYNGTGKTRLSRIFKNLGTDTLYFNAFTEDLFTWDNDLENNENHRLKINQSSRFTKGIQGLALEDSIKKSLNNYVKFNFKINYDDYAVTFYYDNEEDTLKISRGEERIFIWCFFLAIMELAINEDTGYEWVKKIYIDDPISSLDEQNTIAIAHHLAKIVKDEKVSKKFRFVISSHHALFFNVLSNELNNPDKLFLYKDNQKYIIKGTKDTPSFYHLFIIAELKKAQKTDQLYTYHFNMLRNVLEKTATFYGYSNWSECLKFEDDEDDKEKLYSRAINILSHGNYSLYEPKSMLDDSKELFRKILEGFLNKFPFNINTFTKDNSNEQSRK